MNRAALALRHEAQALEGLSSILDRRARGEISLRECAALLEAHRRPKQKTIICSCGEEFNDYGDGRELCSHCEGEQEAERAAEGRRGEQP